MVDLARKKIDALDAEIKQTFERMESVWHSLFWYNLEIFITSPCYAGRRN